MNGSRFVQFLTKLRADAGRPIIVITDNASYHSSGPVQSLGANEESSFNHPLCSSRVIGARNVLLLESCRGRKLLSSTPKARICLRMNH